MKKFFKWISGIFNRTRTFVLRYVQPSVILVENLKMVIDSPAIDLLTEIIPGHIDNYIAAKMRRYLPIILQQLKICEKCASLTDPNEIIKCALAALKEYDKKSQYVYLQGIATKMADALADGKLSWFEIVSMVEYTYQENYKKT